MRSLIARTAKQAVYLCEACPSPHFSPLASSSIPSARALHTTRARSISRKPPWGGHGNATRLQRGDDLAVKKDGRVHSGQRFPGVLHARPDDALAWYRQGRPDSRPSIRIGLFRDARPDHADRPYVYGSGPALSRSLGPAIGRGPRPAFFSTASTALRPVTNARFTPASARPTLQPPARPKNQSAAHPQKLPDGSNGRHLGFGADLSQLPPVPADSPRPVGFASIHHDTVLQRIATSPGVIFVRSPSFLLRAAPLSIFPPRPPPPFPAECLRERREAKTVQFGILATIARISKFASDRNAMKRKLKAALDLVVNRGACLPKGISGDQVISDQFIYTATLTPEIGTVSVDKLTAEVAMALVQVKAKATSQSSQPPRPTGPPKRNFKRR